jgi:hypothetical protein
MHHYGELFEHVEQPTFSLLELGEALRTSLVAGASVTMARLDEQSLVGALG